MQGTVVRCLVEPVNQAWIVLRAGATASEEDLRAFCRAKLAPYKAPAGVEFRTELPKKMVGKVLRRALRESVRPPQSL